MCIRDSLKTEVYNPKTFFPHAASLHQSFLHCAISVSYTHLLQWLLTEGCKAARWSEPLKAVLVRVAYYPAVDIVHYRRERSDKLRKRLFYEPVIIRLMLLEPCLLYTSENGHY